MDEKKLGGNLEEEPQWGKKSQWWESPAFVWVIIFSACLFAAYFLCPKLVHAAPVGKPFLHGVTSPAELAEKVRASLEKNPDGTSVIDLDRCKRDGSCAKPVDYLEMFQKSDPEAKLCAVSQVPDFLMTLQVKPAPAGEYWLACLKSSDKGFKPISHCLSRQFKPGENVWTDPKSGRLALASDCTNPIEKPVPKCVEIHFFTKKPDTVVRFGLLGPADVSDDCIGVKRAGEVEFDRWWEDECAHRGCDFSDDARVVGQPVRLVGSYVPEPGEHILRLPALVAEKDSRYTTVLCLERGPHDEAPKEPPKPTQDMDPATYRATYDAYMVWRELYETWRKGWIADHSDGIGVRWFDYRSFASGTKSVTLWYTKGEVPPGAPMVYWPWHEWGVK